MPDLQPPDWLARLRGYGPEFVALVLAALIAVELGRIALAWLGPARTPEPAGIAASGVPTAQGLDLEAVAAAHLFGVAPSPTTAQDPANAPLSSSNLTLTGTIATQDPRRGVAIISDGGPAKVFAVGDAVGGARLHSVYLDRVILDRAGSLETLVLPRNVPASMARAAPTRARGADPRTAAAVESARERIQQDPGLLDQVMRVVPSYDSAAGKLRGFRAYPGRNRVIFSKLGLKPGDLVTAINGTPLDDPQRSQEVFNTIQSSDRVTVTVERSGQRQDISLNIAQVISQATQALDEPGGAAGTGGVPPAGGAPPGGEPPGASLPPGEK